MALTIIIPTKNRLHDLEKAIASITSQTRPPEQLVLVDQSAEPIPESILASFRGRLPTSSELKYVYNTLISGLVEAKHVGVAHATGDIVCFLEDDIVLEPEYLSQIETSFLADPEICGMSGVVTNTPRPSRTYVFFHELFHCGIFEDPRPRVYADLARRNTDVFQSILIRSPALSGGLSAWRKEVFGRVSFDLASGFHMLEDIDFSIRVQREFGPCLYINPRARLAHNFAPAGRDSFGRRESRKVREFITFYKKHRRDFRDTFWLAWLLLGIAVASGAVSVRHMTPKPIGGVFTGIIAGIRKPWQSDL